MLGGFKMPFNKVSFGQADQDPSLEESAQRSVEAKMNSSKFLGIPSCPHLLNVNKHI